MHIEFAPVDEKYIKDRVKTGYFRSEAEVVRDAIRFAREQWEESENKRLRLLAALKLGENDIAAGRVTPYTQELFEQIKIDARIHAKEGGELKPDAIL